MINKRGAGTGDYLIHWFYRFLIILIVALIFFLIVWSHFSNPYDLRPLESRAIAKECVKCLTDKGFINKFSQDRIIECLNLDEKDVFLSIQFKDQTITFGKEELKIYCQTQEKIEGKYLPSCFNENYSVLGSDGKLDYLNIFIALDKHEKNVK